MISLTAVCALAHFSFILLLLVVLLGTLWLLWRLVLVSLLFFNPPLNLQQPELGLWMV